MKEILDEEATPGGTSAGAIATIASVPGAKRKVSKGGKYGAPKAPQATNLSLIHISEPTRPY